ncbi:fibroblast growth factor 18-like [Clytia hemisphaerica]|uniref:Uncharacterized protein n=1 Tax=Clytia hemisphaerica TaxID=252671 RepID=A0A7M5UGE1_9CNID
MTCIMEISGRFLLTIFLILVAVQSLALCRPSNKPAKTHLFGQEDLILDDIMKRGKLNVSHRRKMKLFSPKSKAYLQVKQNKVDAKGDAKSKFVDLIIESVSYDVIRIKGQHTSNYICFNPRTSKLVAQANGNDINCIFRETFGEKTKRTIFTSVMHKTWQIGIKNNGKPRLGDRPNKTTFHNNTYEFTPLRGRKRKL